MEIRDLLVLFLVFDILSLVLVAVFYLRTRELTLAEYLICGVILFIPVLGPFILIVITPGRKRETGAQTSDPLAKR